MERFFTITTGPDYSGAIVEVVQPDGAKLIKVYSNEICLHILPAPEFIYQLAFLFTTTIEAQIERGIRHYYVGGQLVRALAELTEAIEAGMWPPRENDESLT